MLLGTCCSQWGIVQSCYPLLKLRSRITENYDYRLSIYCPRLPGFIRAFEGSIPSLLHDNSMQCLVQLLQCLLCQLVSPSLMRPHAIQMHEGLQIKTSRQVLVVKVYVWLNGQHYDRCPRFREQHIVHCSSISSCSHATISMQQAQSRQLREFRSCIN